MRLKLRPRLSLTVTCTVALLAFASFAQSPPQRPKLKDFGSSLDRLQRERPKKRTDSKRNEKKTGDQLDEGDVIRTDTNLVTSEISVLDDRGNLVQNLSAEDLLLTEDGEPQKVSHFLRGDDVKVPRTIVLIIDYSGSQLPYIRRSIDAAKVLVDKLLPLDVMAIVTDDVELLVDFTNDKEKLKQKLESLYQRTQAGKLGRSVQYSALMATLNEAFTEEDLRPIIIFQTDGDQLGHLRDPVVGLEMPPDLPQSLKEEMLRTRQAVPYEPNSVDFTLFDLYRTVEKSRATVYTVIPGYRLLGKSQEEQIEIMKKVNETWLVRQGKWSREDQEKYKAMKDKWRIFSPANLAASARENSTIQQALNGVASRAGGWTEFLEKPEEADAIYNRILVDINHRYIIGYYPTNKAHDGTKRRIKFAVKDHPEYHVVGRNYYFSPTQ
jgi:VWFA-related protein